VVLGLLAHIDALLIDLFHAIQGNFLKRNTSDIDSRRALECNGDRWRRVSEAAALVRPPYRNSEIEDEEETKDDS
jgi:hypothetical protein